MNPWATAALLVVLSALYAALGWIFGRQAERNAAARRQPQPICPCTHPISMHDDGAGSCQQQIKRVHYRGDGSRSGREWVRCACLQYMGPELLRDVWAPPGPKELT